MSKEDELKLKTDRKLDSWTILKRNVKYVKPELGKFIASLLLMVVNVGLALVLPLFMQDVTNSLSLNADSNVEFTFNFIKENIKIFEFKDSIIDFNFVLILVITYFLISAINQIILYVEAMLLQKAGQRIVYEMRMEVFTHIENMSQNQFNDMPVGSLFFFCDTVDGE